MLVQGFAPDSPASQSNRVPIHSFKEPLTFDQMWLVVPAALRSPLDPTGSDAHDSA